MTAVGICHRFGRRKETANAARGRVANNCITFEEIPQMEFRLHSGETLKVNQVEQRQREEFFFRR